MDESTVEHGNCMKLLCGGGSHHSQSDAFDTCSTEQKRMIISTHIDKIILEGDNVVVDITLHAAYCLQAA